MIKTIVSLLTLIGIIFGGYFYIDTRYALSETVDKISQRLDYKILDDRLKSVQERLWQLDDRYYKKEMPLSVKEEYRSLQVEKILLIEKLKKEK